MTPTTDATAGPSIETPAGISEGTWYRTVAADSGVYVSTVFMTEASRREAIRSRRMPDDFRVAMLKQLESLLQLEAGWDSYGAPSVSLDAAESAIKLLAPLRKHAKPSVVPTAKGGVQLEWHDESIDIELDCLPSGHAHLFAEDLTSGEMEDRWVVPGHPAIDAWLDRLGTER